LTPDDVGDVSVLSELLDPIEGGVAPMAADGAYDGEAAYSAVTDLYRRPQLSPQVTGLWCKPAARGHAYRMRFAAFRLGV
jgi:hypothetical protein